MRPAAWVCLAAVLAVAGCGTGETADRAGGEGAAGAAARPAAQLAAVLTATGDTAVPGNVRLQLYRDNVCVASGNLDDQDFMTALREELASTLPPDRKSPAVLRAEGPISYGDSATVMVAFSKAGIHEFDLEGVRIRLPDLLARPARNSIVSNPHYSLEEAESPGPHIQVLLYDVGPEGEYIPGGPNDWLWVTVNGQALPFHDGGPLGRERAIWLTLRDLGIQLAAVRGGVPADMLVSICPTIESRHSWAVGACKAAAAAGFTNIMLGVPYE